MGYSGDKKREYNRNWMQKRRNEFFKDKVCVQCKSDKNLEVDHINPEDKEFNPTQLWSRKKVFRMEE